MSDLSPILDLPYIQPAQAQKHVTHNEAIRLLDVIVQLAVADRSLSAPPALPVLAERHIVAAGASGLWAGRAGWIAIFTETGWQFVDPRPGWRAQVLDEAVEVVFAAGVWTGPAEGALRVAELGVNATPDATNRLAVAAPATLLTHAGAGHQLKLNKAAASDTASLLFQTGFSGRAEMGLAGTDDFAIRVSADGTTFRDALTVAAATGALRAPQGLLAADGSAAAPGLAFADDADTGLRRPGADQIGLVTGGVQRALLGNGVLQVDVPLTGTAVQSSATDVTGGRALMLRSGGSFGLGATSQQPAWPNTSLNNVAGVGVGFYTTTGSNTDLPPGGVGWLFFGRRVVGSGQFVQAARGLTSGQWQRFSNGGTEAAPTWGAWSRVYDQTAVLGTVSLAAGVPTGALIETGTNANGFYRRFACGMQICWRSDLTTANASTALGGLFRSADVTWTFPAAFLAGSTHAVSGTAADADCWVTAGAQSVTATTLRVLAAMTKATTQTLRVSAVGRWA